MKKILTAIVCGSGDRGSAVVTNATLLFYDGSWQAYRIPVII